MGRNPKLKIIQATHNTELAVRFGRKVRDLIADPQYQEVFPDTNLKEDSKSAGRWQTSVGGEYFAAGVGAQSRVVVRICLLLTTRTRNRTLFRSLRLIMRMNGTRLGRDNVFNLVVRSSW